MIDKSACGTKRSTLPEDCARAGRAATRSAARTSAAACIKRDRIPILRADSPVAVIARSAATKQSPAREPKAVGDCFASLAMTSTADRRHFDVEQSRGVAAEYRPALAVVEPRGAFDKADRVDFAHVGRI